MKKALLLLISTVLIIITIPGCPESSTKVYHPTSIENAREIPCPLTLEHDVKNKETGAPASSCRAPGSLIKCHE